MTERNLRDHTGLKAERRFAHPRCAFAFENDHDLGELLLDVRTHAAAGFELTSQDCAEGWPGVGIAQVPHPHGAAAAEQTLAVIMRIGLIPHVAFGLGLTA